MGKAELLPVSPYSPHFPKSGCAQKQIIQFLRMQPRHLSQPEHLIFYRLKCMQIGPSPRELPQGAKGRQLMRSRVGEGSSREVGVSHHEMTSPFSIPPPCPCAHSRWLSTQPPSQGWLIVLKKLRQRG